MGSSTNGEEILRREKESVQRRGDDDWNLIIDLFDGIRVGLLRIVQRVWSTG